MSTATRRAASAIVRHVCRGTLHALGRYRRLVATDGPLPSSGVATLAVASTIAFTIVLGAAPRTADAFEVHPLVHRIDAYGRQSSSNVIVTNSSDQPLPVEFTAYALEYDGVSAQRGAPADEELLVFPPSAIVAPGRVQAARVQWLGEPDIESARSYIVTVEQVPASGASADEASGVQVLLTFNVYVHVSPPGAEPRLVVRERRVESANGRSTLHFHLANEGNGNAFGSLMTFELEGEGRVGRVLPEADDVGTAELFFPPGFERDVELPLPGDAWPATTTVDIVYDE